MILRLVVLFLVGGILGATCDGFHTHSGTLGYYNPWHWMMAWWVPPLFGVATLSIAISHPLMDKHFKRKAKKVSALSVIGGLVGFVAMYYASGFWQAPSLVKTAIFSAGFFALWFAFDRTWQGVVFALATAAIGSLFESTLIHSGAFFYTKPDFIGVPYWLPTLYAAASIAVGNWGRKLKQPGRRALRGF